MRVEHGVLRSACRVAPCVAMTLALLLGAACEHFQSWEEPAVARAVALDGGAELPVVMSRLGGRSRRIVSGADSIRIGIHFDPEMIDVENVASYVLWGCGAESSDWQRIREIAAADLPVSLPFREGTVGLRASARYRDGEEAFVPAAGERPVVWLVVDRSPPSITWLRPAASAPVSTAESVELAWTINEVEVGPEPSVLEWSADGGRTWRPIASVAPQSGHQSHPWKAPPELLGPCQVRLTARDLVGHSDSVVLSFEVVSAPTAGEHARRSRPAGSPPGTAAVPGVAGEAGRAATSAGPAAGEVASGAKTVAGTLLPADSPLTLEPLPASVVAGGRQAEVRWRSTGVPADQDVKVEWSRDRGATWELAGTSPASAGAVSWSVPRIEAPSCLLRVSTRAPDGPEHVSVGARPFGIDCSAPKVSLMNVPEVAGPSARFELSSDDGEGSGLAGVTVFLRERAAAGASGAGWRALPASAVDLEQKGTSSGRALLTLDLGSVSEASYELFLAAVDGVGNRAAAPDAGTAAAGAFALDKTPPRLEVTPYPLSWVEGMLADIQIDADWRDIELPVVLLGRGSPADEGWRELARWTRLPPNTRQFSWNVPTGFSEMSVKVEAKDRAGNTSSAVINSRRVEPAIYLKEFSRGTVVDGGTTRPILWELHSAAVRRADELRVHVEYQQGAGRTWETICADLTVLERCVWEVPQGDGSDGHRIRLRLQREGQLVSEYRSEPFTIRAGLPAYQEPLIAQDSMEYFEIARAFVEKYRDLRRELAGKTVTPEAQDRLDELVQRARESFEKALELAENNYHAAYGYAQFLNRLPSRDDRQVERLLGQVIRSKPTHHWAYNDLGALYIREQRYEEAVTALRAAAKLEPSADVHYNLGLALFHERKMAEARAQFEAALTSPRQGRVHHGVLYYYMIHTFLQEGHMLEAQALYQKEAAKIPAELRDGLREVFET